MSSLPSRPEVPVDTSKRMEPLKTLYEYKATVVIAKKYTIRAESDEALEEAVFDSLVQDGINPDEFELVRLHSHRTPIQWQ